MTDLISILEDCWVRAIITSFQDPRWPGLEVCPLDPSTGLRYGCCYYLDSEDDFVIRILLSIERMDREEHGVALPKALTREDLPEDVRDAIWENFNSLSPPPEGLPPVMLVKAKVNVEVRGSAEALRRYGSEIPSHWKRVAV